ncbi:MAG: hypothetical protein ACP5U0_09475, partial [Caldisphaera sp.]
SFIKQTMKKQFIKHEDIKEIVKKERKNRLHYYPSQRKLTYKDSLKEAKASAGDIYAYKQLKRDINKNYLASYLFKNLGIIGDEKLNSFSEAYIKSKYSEAIDMTYDLLSGEGSP